MKITVIGWYGTETIGDRAILAGLISFFSKSFEKIEIYLGSLYPFFSERTLVEDSCLYQNATGRTVTIDLFNSKDSKALNDAIRRSELVVMGGGPLMDIDELFMVEYAFKKCKRLKVKTALLGCGIGPLFYKKYRKSVLQIALNSDLIVLRDTNSKDYLASIYHEFNKPFYEDRVYSSFDPAAQCVLEYKKREKEKSQSYIAVNLREFPVAYTKSGVTQSINKNLKNFIASLSEAYPEILIRLVPMHYFHVGNDDRVFLNSIALDIKNNNISVQNKPLSLVETVEVYQNAHFNIGMRFHSVVFQTIASGKNFVLDYTEPKKGKTFGFLKDIDPNGFYSERYISLQRDQIATNFIKNEQSRFRFDRENVSKHLSVYVDQLQTLM